MTDAKQSAINLKPVKYINNLDFYKGLGSISFLRDIGKHFRVNQMLSRDSVKSRIKSGKSDCENSGISYTEFSYQILQANDFYMLNKKRSEGGEECAIQIGGSDQWGNIVAGIDYIRRKTGHEAFGLTIPLLTNASGEKFGKSTGGGCLWLDADKTSPYQLYQYIMNVPDSDLEALLFRLTFLSHDEIFSTLQDHVRQPESRLGQKLLASTIVKMVHGQSECKHCEQSTDAFFAFDCDRLASMSEPEFLSHFS